MAYIPELLATEEALASAYDLSNGKTVFTSTDIIELIYSLVMLM